jgi:CheY-like chemotaxis protein
MDKYEGHIVSALVVEDEPDYANLIAGILEEDGYSVTTASDGVEALDRVRANRPDVITLDVQMPRKGGVQFYRELKSDPEFNEIPVVVITGITRDDKDMENFVRAFLEVEHLPMPDAYLEKPVENEELLRVVRDALRVAP